MKPLTTQTGPGCATKNINSDSKLVSIYSTVNVVAAGRWPASSIFGPQQDPAVKSPSVRLMKPLTTLRPARATKNINLNSDSNYSTVNVVAAGRWPASSIFGPQQDPAVGIMRGCIQVLEP